MRGFSILGAILASLFLLSVVSADGPDIDLTMPSGNPDQSVSNFAFGYHTVECSGNETVLSSGWFVSTNATPSTCNVLYSGGWADIPNGSLEMYGQIYNSPNLEFDLLVAGQTVQFRPYNGSGNNEINVIFPTGEQGHYVTGAHSVLRLDFSDDYWGFSKDGVTVVETSSPLPAINGDIAWTSKGDGSNFELAFQYLTVTGNGGTTPSETPEPTVDSDGDGVLDSEDYCPLTPGPVYNDGCPEIEHTPAPTATPTDVQAQLDQMNADIAELYAERDRIDDTMSFAQGRIDNVEEKNQEQDGRLDFLFDWYNSFTNWMSGFF